jgi:tRNA A37 methylthiotransferase MiaB
VLGYSVLKHLYSMSAASTTPAEAAAKEAELEVAVKRFQELRSKEQQLLTKINEMVAQEAEYRLVRQDDRDERVLCGFSAFLQTLFDEGAAINATTKQRSCRRSTIVSASQTARCLLLLLQNSHRSFGADGV